MIPPGPLQTKIRRAHAIRMNMCASCFKNPRTKRHNAQGVRYMSCDECLKRKLREAARRQVV